MLPSAQPGRHCCDFSAFIGVCPTLLVEFGVQLAAKEAAWGCEPDPRAARNLARSSARHHATAISCPAARLLCDSEHLAFAEDLRSAAQLRLGPGRESALRNSLRLQDLGLQVGTLARHHDRMEHSPELHFAKLLRPCPSRSKRSTY